MKVEESLNVTFNETPPLSKTSPLEDDDLVEEEAIEVSKTRPLGNNLEDNCLENNRIINIKESKIHPLENVIGLWYPKGSGIETIVSADSDHAGDYVDRKSTSGIFTFMGCCLTSWFSKKQIALAISTTEAEYVSAEKACQQALWMKQALVDYGISVLHAQTTLSPQGDNHTQHPLPPSPSREMLMNDINQLQDLSNLLAMHLSQRNNSSSSYSPNLPHTINLDQVEQHVGYCPYSQVSNKSKAGLGYKELIPESFVNSFELLEKQDNRSDTRYHEVPPPLTGNYMPSKRDLRLIDEYFESESVDVSTVSSSDVKTVDHKGVFSTEEPKPVRKNNFGPPIIKDWHLDDDSKDELSPTVEVKTVKPSVEKIESVKTARETVKTEESSKQHKHHPRGNQRN
nr:retrovirus-related Pol polyprotein from transposon TNT 1-94 [Tanacetum cinerariifolium]